MNVLRKNVRALGRKHRHIIWAFPCSVHLLTAWFAQVHTCKLTGTDWTLPHLIFVPSTPSLLHIYTDQTAEATLSLYLHLRNHIIHVHTLTLFSCRFQCCAPLSSEETNLYHTGNYLLWSDSVILLVMAKIRLCWTGDQYDSNLMDTANLYNYEIFHQSIHMFCCMWHHWFE